MFYKHLLLKTRSRSSSISIAYYFTSLKRNNSGDYPVDIYGSVATQLFPSILGDVVKPQQESTSKHNYDLGY